MIVRSPGGNVFRYCYNGSDPHMNFTGPQYDNGEYAVICNNANLCNADFGEKKTYPWRFIIPMILLAFLILLAIVGITWMICQCLKKKSPVVQEAQQPVIQVKNGYRYSDLPREETPV